MAAHVGDMMQVHLHTSPAHPACEILEYIPWVRSCLPEPATVRDGDFVPPAEPGAGSTPTAQAFEKYAKPLR